MKEEKAYKLLSIQEDISNRNAKELIDKGVVYARGKKIQIARAPMRVDTVFKIEKIEEPRLIEENESIIVLDKPAFTLTEDIAQSYGYPPLHRLDRETSGVLILAKDEEYRLKAIEEFKQKRVEKIYYAIVRGKVAEPFSVDAPLITQKTKGQAFTKISKHGKEAITLVEPALIEGNYSLVKIHIQTGRTHQIRVHLQTEGFPILGDTKYGGKEAKRVMLHAYKISLLGESFTSNLPSVFRKYGFNL